MPALPVVRVLDHGVMVARHPFDEFEGTRADDLGRRVRTVHGVFVEDAQVLQEIEDTRPWLVRLQDDGVLVGLLPACPPRATRRDDRGERVLWIACAEQVVLDVVAGEFAAGVELDALAQVQLDLGVVGALLPAFGQPWRDIQVVVVVDQHLVDLAERVVRHGRPQDGVDGDQVADLTPAQRAAGLDLRRGWRGCGTQIPSRPVRHQRRGAGAVVAAAAGLAAVGGRGGRGCRRGRSRARTARGEQRHTRGRNKQTERTAAADGHL